VQAQRASPIAGRLTNGAIRSESPCGGQTTCFEEPNTLLKQ